MNLLPAEPEAEALVTDRYLDAILSAHERRADDAPADAAVDPRVRLAARRLSRDLTRVHPSFRFEERLAARLAEAAGRMRLEAAGGEGQLIPLAFGPVDRDAIAPVLAAAAARTATRRSGPSAVVPRPLLIGVTSAALSLAGAVYVAWRRGRAPATPASAEPMARALRAAQDARLAASRGRAG